MQKKRLIPTPLREGPRPPVQIAPAYKPGRFYLLRVLRFVLGLAWFWWRSSFSLYFTGQARTAVRARRIREFLEGMGGLWIKAGQIVAMRRDLFLKDTCDELSKLQDRAQGFPFAQARRVLEEDLGPLSEIFSELHEAPVAAASIGQTHEGRLRENGARVAIKVQRPLVRERFAQDMRYVRFVATCLRQLGIAPQGRWDEMVWELEKALAEELDYRMEAASIARMRKTLRQHKIYAPKVFLRHCSSRVLVMEYVEGVFMSDYIQAASSDPARLQRWLKENNIDPEKVGERLLMSRNRQVHEDNLYHGDLHPGNILLQRDSRIALIDFGAVGSLDQSTREKYHLMISALAERNYQKVVDVFLLLCPPLPQGDPSELKAELVRLLRTWESRTVIKHLPYHEKSLTGLSGMMAGLLQKYAVPSNWEFLQLNRADLTLDASLIFLLPKINYIRMLRRYHEKARKRAMRTGPKQLKRALQTLWSAGKVPAMLAENLYFDGEWMRQRALGFQGKISKLAYVAQGVFSALALAAMGGSLLFIGHWLMVYHQVSLPLAQRPWARELLSALPRWAPELILGVAVGAMYLSRKLVQMRRYVVQKDFNPTR